MNFGKALARTIAHKVRASSLNDLTEDHHAKVQKKIKNFSHAHASFIQAPSCHDEDARSTGETTTAWWEVLGVGH